MGVCSQNVSKYTNTSLTGEVTSSQLKDIDINWVILGGSDRRRNFKENEKDICDKALEALDHGMQVVICMGDSYFANDTSRSDLVIEK